ncbi:MAG: glutamate-5-semialdehyde dehydrogenase [Cytophagales bacterium]|nr:MAG: glutamate-5-semialdehyde dehydrogenase [Cytophagales bacterium]
MSFHSIFKQAQQASRKISLLEESKTNQILKDLATLAVANTSFIVEENAKDLAKMDETDPKYDRLKLTPKRIADIAEDILNVSRLPSPLGKIVEEKTNPNGLFFQKITVPLGVIGIIYEARPNVTFDVFALCLKAGNVSVLKGGSDAHFSNVAILQTIHQVLENHGIDKNIVQLLPPDREATTALLNAVGLVDVIIPRGSQQLINFVRQNAKVPVIETGAGIVHIYFDESADLEKGAAIINNSKTRRVSVCNALDCLIINEKRLADLPAIGKLLAETQVEIYADETAHLHLKNQYPEHLLYLANEEHFGTEFLAYKMAVKTVKDLAQALDHIAAHSSKHSEAIISEDENAINIFLKNVDAAAVYANASTAFTDGGQFGLGAEIGISTQKLHARGPMALAEITSYKWIVRGSGQIRN